MRIALVNPRRQRRGGELFSRRLARELRRRGHELVEVYLYPPHDASELEPADSEICLGGRERGGLERFTRFDPQTAARLRSATRGCDVVQVSGGRCLAYAALALPKTHGEPALVYRNIGDPNCWFRGPAHRWLYDRWVFPRVDAVTTVAESYVSPLERRCPNALVRSIRSGLAESQLRWSVAPATVRDSLGTRATDPVVLFAGRLSPEKRVDRLLRAFAAGGERVPEAVLWIAGDGPLRTRLEQQAESLGIGRRVRFLGVRDDVPDLLHASDVVTLTSDTEGVPGVLTEAAGLGRPAVATRAGATAEVVEHGETGLLVDLEDEVGLARGLFDLLSNGPRRRLLGSAARTAQAGATLEAAAGEHERLYRDAQFEAGRTTLRGAA